MDAFSTAGSFGSPSTSYFFSRWTSYAVYAEKMRMPVAVVAQ